MIEQPNLITQALRHENDIYFLYDSKFKWSISRTGSGEYYLNYYPGTQSLEELSTPNEWEREKVDLITYSTKDIKTKEATASFSELYQMLQGRLYGIDDVLNQIINTAA